MTRKVAKFITLFAFAVVALPCFLNAEEEVTPESALNRIALTEITLVEWDALPKGMSATDRVDGYIASVVEDKEGNEVFYLRLPRDGKTYRISNIPLPRRMTSDLIFSDPGRLNFNRWHSPHYGWHYEIDCRNLVAVEIRPFGDLFFVNGFAAQQTDAPEPSAPVDPTSRPPSVPAR